MKIIAYNHTHWDREWYKTFQEFRLRFVEVIDLIIKEITNENIDCFYLDGQTVILEDYFELYPENKAIIQELISKNKIIIGPWYALADEFLVSGESLFRNMFIGIKQAKELGCDKFIGYLPDSFGHSSEITRILSSFGIKNSVLWRGAGSQNSEFIWKSEDDSSVIATYLIEGYFQNFLHDDVSIEKKAENLKKFLDKIKEYSSSEYILLPIGGDHLGPVIDLKNQLQKIESILKDYTFESGGVFEYIEKIKDLSTINEFQGELRDNSRNPILPGTLSTRIYLKQENAISTWKLSKIAEPFNAFVKTAFDFPQKNNELEYAWKLLLKNHPHDSICGCSIDEVHREMLPRFAQVNQICDGLILRGQNAISQLVNKNSIWVYNLSDKEFNGIIKIKTSGKLPENLKKQFVKSTQEFPKEILLDTQRPPFSEDIEEFKEYLVYVENIAPNSLKIIDENYKYSKTPDIVQISENHLKNSRIKIDLNPDGTLKLTDFELNKEFDGLHYFYDRADIGDSYNYSPLKNDKPLKSKFLRTEIIENGELRSTLRVYYELDIPAYFDETQNCRSIESHKTVITTDISINCGSKRAEFQTCWENKSKDHILQVKFKFNEKITETFAENTFGILRREINPDWSVSENIPVPKGQELKTNTAPMQRFVWSGLRAEAEGAASPSHNAVYGEQPSKGLGVITEGLNEFGVNDSELYITILRSVGKLSKLSLNTRNFPAGPPLDTPEAQCLGKQTVKYAICATENPSELFKESDEFFGNIIADIGSNNNNTETKALTFLKTDNENIYTYSVKSSENKDGIVFRLMNLSNEIQHVSLQTDLSFSSYAEVNGIEETLSKPENFEQKITFKPYELKNILFKKA